MEEFTNKRISRFRQRNEKMYVSLCMHDSISRTNCFTSFNLTPTQTGVHNEYNPRFRIHQKVPVKTLNSRLNPLEHVTHRDLDFARTLSFSFCHNWTFSDLCNLWYEKDITRSTHVFNWIYSRQWLLLDPVIQ